MGKAYGHEFSLHTLSTHFLDGELCELSCERGVLSAGDAQDVARGAGCAQVVRQEIDARSDLRCDVDSRLYTKLFRDLFLQLLIPHRHSCHSSGLAQAEWSGNIVPRCTAVL